MVLGIHYDTVSWSWSVPDEKLLRLLHNLRAALSGGQVRQDAMWTIVGKILHVMPLVPGGRFQLFHLLRANAVSDEPDHILFLDDWCRRQLWFWFTILRACSGRASIPNPSLALPASALDVYTDAAGGSMAGDGRGAGAVCGDWWAYVPWGATINSGSLSVDGRRLDAAMSVLELLGPLLALAAVPSAFAGRDARFWVDNAAAVFIWKKGYSTTCSLSSVVVSAMADVAACLGCRVELVKVARCSTGLASMADALSMGAFARFRGLAAEHGVQPVFVGELSSRALLEWIAAPSPDWDLGRRLVEELRRAGLGLHARL